MFRSPAGRPLGVYKLYYIFACSLEIVYAQHIISSPSFFVMYNIVIRVNPVYAWRRGRRKENLMDRPCSLPSVLCSRVDHVDGDETAIVRRQISYRNGKWSRRKRSLCRAAERRLNVRTRVSRQNERTIRRPLDIQGGRNIIIVRQQLIGITLKTRFSNARFSIAPYIKNKRTGGRPTPVAEYSRLYYFPGVWDGTSGPISD